MRVQAICEHYKDCLRNCPYKKPHDHNLDRLPCPNTCGQFQPVPHCVLYNPDSDRGEDDVHM